MRPARPNPANQIRQLRLAVWARDGAEEAGGAIADTLDALTSDRPYRKATSVEVALDRMARWAGGQLSPSIVAILLRVPVESSS